MEPDIYQEHDELVLRLARAYAKITILEAENAGLRAIIDSQGNDEREAFLATHMQDNENRRASA